MKNSRKSPGIDRREFLATTGTSLLAATMPGVAKGPTPSGVSAAFNSPKGSPEQTSSGALRKIPIGVFDPVYDKLSLDEMLERVSALGLEAMEIGTGGYPGTGHCPVDELLADAAQSEGMEKEIRGSRNSRGDVELSWESEFIRMRSTRRTIARAFARRYCLRSGWKSA